MSILRRRFLGSALTASAVEVLLHAGEERAVAETPELLAIENDHLAIAIDRRTGCVDRLESKDGSWKLKGGELRHLGTDIQFCLVLSDSRGIYLGYHDRDQKLPRRSECDPSCPRAKPGRLARD